MHLCVDSPPENTPPLVITRAHTHTSFLASLSHLFLCSGSCLPFAAHPHQCGSSARVPHCVLLRCCFFRVVALLVNTSIHRAAHIDPQAHTHRWCVWVPAMQPHVRISLWIYTGARWLRCMATVVHSELTDTPPPLPPVLSPTLPQPPPPPRARAADDGQSSCGG
jgi:hypothetical protein